MALYRKFNNLIFMTIAGSILALVILGASFGTKAWYKGKGSSIVGETRNEMEASVGLFAGDKYLLTYFGSNLLTRKPVPVKIVCENGVCIYSCGVTAEFRKAELLLLWAGLPSRDSEICPTVIGTTSARDKREITPTQNPGDKQLFLSYGLWLTTLVFLCGGLAFSALSAGFALYNTYRAPISPIFSVFGLYIWNGGAAACTLLVMIIWGVAFSGMNSTTPFGNTIGGEFSRDSASLGYSYWILILAELLSLANIGILRYRTWKILQIETTLHVVDTKATNPDSMIF